MILRGVLLFSLNIFYFGFKFSGYIQSVYDRRVSSSEGPTHPLSDGHYLLYSLGASQYRSPEYLVSGVNTATRDRAQ